MSEYEIKRRMDAEPDEDTVIMKSQMQEVEERENRSNEYKAQKRLKEKASFARTSVEKVVKRDGKEQEIKKSAIEKVTKPDGSEYYRKVGKTTKEKAEEKRQNKSDREKLVCTTKTTKRKTMGVGQETRRLAFLDSSMAEHPAVNRRVVGSRPTRGATGKHFACRIRINRPKTYTRTLRHKKWKV